MVEPRGRSQRLTHMAIPMTSSGSLADLEDDRATIVFDQPLGDERRSKVRYTLDLSIRFRSVSGSTLVSGAGRTLNLSSGGVLVFSEHVALNEIGGSAVLEMSIEWPFMLDNRIPLQLFAVGRILRRGTSTFAARFDRHQFRTRSSSQVPAQS